MSKGGGDGGCWRPLGVLGIPSAFLATATQPAGSWPNGWRDEIGRIA